MANYRISSAYAGGRCLNINGDNITSLSKNQNVTLWTSSGTAEQTWVIDSLGTNVLIKSAVDPSFALNAYRSSTTKYNCDVYPWSGNEADSKVNFVATTGGYRIKLTNHDMYLTAEGTVNSSNVSWSKSSGGQNQIWTCTQVAAPEPPSYTYEQKSVILNNKTIYLYAVTTTPENIYMVNRQGQGSGLGSYCGMNGGIFSTPLKPGDPECRNFAINNSAPVGPGENGNLNDVGHAAIAYVQGKLRHIPYPVQFRYQLDNALGNAAPIWVQGGGDLKLGDSTWTKRDLYMSGSDYDTYARAALVVNTVTNKVYLIIHKQPSINDLVSVKSFRDAIYQYLGIRDGMTAFAGLVLDGGGSTTLRARNSAGQMTGPTTGRALYQIITLRK